MASIVAAPSVSDRSNYSRRFRLPSVPPLWLEGRIMAEYLALVRDPVFYGRGYARVQSRSVLLIPGFFAGDATLGVMSDWLERMGHRPQAAGIRLNILKSDVLLNSLQRRLLDQFRQRRRKVTVIGHSRGGLLAKVLADRHPALVDQVVALGSPLRDPFDVHPLTMAGVHTARLINFVRHPGTAERHFLAELAAGPKVPVTSIYTRSDGVVNWKACVDAPGITCHEVRGSHIGLALNREVYRALAALLNS
jgi:pimeloyl-ACP methyl ester carboxylesterase